MDKFYFEGRDLPYGAEPMRENELVLENTYFAVTYFDNDLLIPSVETLVFIGSNLEDGDAGELYFQHIYSHQKGQNYRSIEEREELGIQVYSKGSINHIFEYERALEQLMVCSIRRRVSDLGRMRDSDPRG